MASPATRISFLQFVFFGGLAAVVGRAVQLQVIEGRKWAKVAEETRTETKLLAPRRGTIYDRSGAPLAVSQEFYRVEVAVWEVPGPQRDRLAQVLTREIGIPTARVRSVFRQPDADRPYLYWHPPLTASEVEPLRRFKGVKLRRLYLRHYPAGGMARSLIGGLESDDAGKVVAHGRYGLERSLDSLLTWVPGEAGFLRDRRGVLYESPDRLVRDPVPGHDVLLTLDTELQSIADAALAEALEDQQADAGDVVLVDPRSGEILAMATVVRREEGARRAGAWVPAEPGSTLKPFAAAALLQLGRARAGDSVYGENGVYAVPGRSRPIRDDHPVRGWMTLATAIEKSSNVGMVKFTSKLGYGEHFDVLRDFGFGTPTGLEVSGESAGRLKRPDTWQPGNTQPSMAQGYEIEVTPLQLAAAYAALANDGLLPSLTLIREIRDHEGRVVYRHEPSPVRRVVRAEVAAQIRGFLRAAASTEGTGSRAQLDRYVVLGKTGTARNVVRGAYTNSYTSSFAGIFHADDPQLVVVIRIVNPTRGDYYGGLVAAPIMREMLRNALSARRSALDRARLAELPAATVARSPARQAPPAPAAPVIMDLPIRRKTDSTRVEVEVPQVQGMSIRQAAVALHRRGLRVKVEGRGTVTATSPAAGAMVPAAAVVQVRADGREAGRE
ncbi:MAG TPA: penicillin-binding transpeptidase domain-containing protein [Gemmatimonadales bacterium]|nr:penicillin-binding transpeptidase domain-containing protein [Gemmatimonadales bacterium]